jgi:hypothetical protein
VVAVQLVLDAPVAPAAGDGFRDRGLTAVLPIEQTLVALALVATFPRSLASAATALFGLSLAGFALHTSSEHVRLASSNHGRPAFEPDVAREASVNNGLLFFDDDPGYELASDPAVPASHGIQAVRMRNDDHDRLLYDLLGHPPAHHYLTSPTTAAVVAWTPPGEGSDFWRFEAESDWPPVMATGRARAAIVEQACASGGRALALEPAGVGEAAMLLELPAPRGATPAASHSWTVVPRVLQRGGPGSGHLEVVEKPGSARLVEWSWSDATQAPSCTDLAGQTVELGGERRRAWLVVTARGGPVAIDRTTLQGH